MTWGPGEKHEVTYVHEQSWTSAGGNRVYLIPVGSYFAKYAGQFSVEIDKGTGFAPATEGVDYSTFKQAAQLPEVDDMRFGIYLSAAPPDGWVIRLQWLEGVVLKTPMGIAKVRLDGSNQPDFTKTWRANSVDAPNGVTVPTLNGYAVEFWRKTFKPGGALQWNFRGGSRFKPYWRGAVDQFTFHRNDFVKGQPEKRWKYRVCYYNPDTYARSALSPDIIVANNGKPDKVGLPALNTVPPLPASGQVREGGSVWIE